MDANLDVKILEYAIEKARMQFPETFEHKVAQGVGTATGEDTLSLADDFLNSLEKSLTMNGAFSDTIELNPVNKAARASHFVTSAVTTAYMLDKIKNNIDEFVADPNNKASFGSLDDEQILEYAKELKNEVTKKMMGNSNSPEGNQFMSDMIQKFDDIRANSKGEEHGADAPEVDTPQHQLLMESLSAVHALNWEILGSRDAETSMAKTKEAFKDSEIASFILGRMEENGTEFAADSRVGSSMYSADEQPEFLMSTGEIEVEKKGSFISRLINFIKRALGMGKENTAEKDSTESHREKMSFDELSGLNAVTKMTSSKQDELSTEKTSEKKAPSKGK